MNNQSPSELHQSQIVNFQNKNFNSLIFSDENPDLEKLIEIDMENTNGNIPLDIDLIESLDNLRRIKT